MTADRCIDLTTDRRCGRQKPESEKDWRLYLPIATRSRDHEVFNNLFLVNAFKIENNTKD